MQIDLFSLFLATRPARRLRTSLSPSQSSSPFRLCHLAPLTALIGLLTSTVSAQVWEDITANVGSNFLGTNEAMVSDGQRLFIMGGEGIGVLMSEDNGETFRPVNTVNGASYTLADGWTFDGIYVANGEVWLGAQNWGGVGFQNVHRLPAGSEVWEQTDLPSGASFGALQDVIYEPVSSQYFVAGSAGGVYTSGDARNWTDVDDGVTQLTNGLLALATVNGRVFALNAFGSPSLRMTTDGGATWTPVSDYSTTNGPGRPLHAVNGTIVAVETGLNFTSVTHLSTDAGDTWETVVNSPDSLNNNLSSDGSVLFAPIRVSEAIAAALGISFLNYSSDAGRSWQTLPTDGISSELIYQGVAASQATVRRQGDYLFLIGDISIDFGASFEGRLYRIPTAGLGLDTNAPSGGFADWSALLALPENQRGPDATPANDGIANLVKYAVGVNPLESALGRLPEMVVEGTGIDAYPEVCFIRDTSAGGVTSRVQASQDLTFDTEIGTTIVSTEDLGGGLERICIRSNEPFGQLTKQFFRLVVEIDD